MAWGIPGNVGEIYRKQQSDELKDQLLQQTLAQRIKEAEAEQEYRKQQLQAQIEERAAAAKERQSEQDYRTGQLARQTKLDTEAADIRGGQQRAISNVQGLIPFMQSPGARDEVTAQALRISPDRAVSELLREPPTRAERVYKVPDGKGGYINKAFTPEEERAGIPGYVEPQADRRPRIDIRNVPARGPNGEPGTNVITFQDGVPVNEKWVAGNPSAGERSGLADFETLNGLLDAVTTQYRPELVGPAAGRYGAVAQNVPGIPVPKGFTELSSTLAQLQNTILYLRSGKQINEQEFGRFMNELPSMNSKPADFVKKLANTKALMKETLANRQKMAGVPQPMPSHDGAGGSAADLIYDPATKTFKKPGA